MGHVTLDGPNDTWWSNWHLMVQLALDGTTGTWWTKWWLMSTYLIGKWALRKWALHLKRKCLRNTSLGHSDVTVGSEPSTHKNRFRTSQVSCGRLIPWGGGKHSYHTRIKRSMHLRYTYRQGHVEEAQTALPQGERSHRIRNVDSVPFFKSFLCIGAAESKPERKGKLNRTLKNMPSQPYVSAKI